MNISHYITCLKEFHNSFDQPLYSSLATTPKHTLDLRLKLIQEEEQELVVSNNRIDELDAIVDLIYVTVGSLITTNLTYGNNGSSTAEDISVLIDKLVDEWNKPHPCNKMSAYYLSSIISSLSLRAKAHEYRLDEAFDAVHKNNMEKLWTVEQLRADEQCHAAKKGDKYLVKNKEGKVIKPPNHTKVKLEEYV